MLGGAIAVIALSLAPGASFAAEQFGDECSATVWSAPDAPFLNLDKVQQQVDQLTALGADVRIRTYGDREFGFLPDREDTLLANCESWSALDGGIKDNMLIYMLSPSEVIFDFSPQWGITEAEYQIIQDDRMGTGASDTAALVEGMKATFQVLTSEPAPLDNQSADDRDASSSGSSISARGVGLVASVIVLLVGLVIAWTMIKDRLADRKLLREAKALAQAAKDTAEETIGDLIVNHNADDKSGIELSLSSLRDDLEDADYAPLETLVNQAKRAQNEVLSRNGVLDERPIGRLKTVDDCQQVRADYADLLTQAKAAIELVNQAREALKQMDESIKNAPAELAALRSFAETTKEVTIRLRKKGFTVFGLGDVDTLLAEADKLVQAKQPAKAVGKLAEARGLLEKQNKAMQEQEALYLTLTERRQQLLKRLAAADRVYSQVDDRLQELSRHYADSCFAKLTSARKQAGSVANITRLLEDARTTMTVEQLDMDKAGANLDLAQSQLDTIARLSSQVEESVTTLSDTKQRCEAMLQDLQDGVTATQRQFENEKISKKTEEGIMGLKPELDSLADQLKRDRPDVVEIAKELDKLDGRHSELRNRALDEIAPPPPPQPSYRQPTGGGYSGGPVIITTGGSRRRGGGNVQGRSKSSQPKPPKKASSRGSGISGVRKASSPRRVASSARRSVGRGLSGVRRSSRRR